MSILGTREDLRNQWRSLTGSAGAGARADDLCEQLIAAYGESHRRYHSLQHLTWLLNEEERRAALIRDRKLVQFAIWFHDAIYDPLAKDNEERSADWARQALTDLHLRALAESVSTLVLKTKDHLYTLQKMGSVINSVKSYQVGTQHAIQ